MAFHFRCSYPPDIEEHMRNCFTSLSEKDRRRYAAVEAVKLGHGGITYLTHVFGCSAELIEHGLQDLDQLPHDPAGKRIRQVGGGKKRLKSSNPM